MVRFPLGLAFGVSLALQSDGRSQLGGGFLGVDGVDVYLIALLPTFCG